MREEFVAGEDPREVIPPTILTPLAHCHRAVAYVGETGMSRLALTPIFRVVIERPLSE